MRAGRGGTFIMIMVNRITGTNNSQGVMLKEAIMVFFIVSALETDVLKL
jgi:hypothetical protein